MSKHEVKRIQVVDLLSGSTPKASRICDYGRCLHVARYKITISCGSKMYHRCRDHLDILCIFDDLSLWPIIKDSGLRARRIKLGVSQRQVAEALQITQPLISSIEKGDSTPLQEDRIRAALEHLEGYDDIAVGLYDLTVNNTGQVSN